MMNRSRRKFLSCPGFTIDQDAAIGRSRHRDLLAERPNRNAFTNHRVVVFELFAKTKVIRFKLPLTQSISDGQDSSFYLERLLDKVESTQPGRSHCSFDIRVAADHNDRSVWISSLQAFQSFDAIDSRKPYVKQNTTKLTSFEILKTLLARSRGLDRHPLVFEHSRQRAAYSFLIIDNKN